jgi:uncharacterized glyoxalase superfamily protein PhnB
MPQNPPEGYPALMPYLYYEDPDAALDFLTGAFGFREKYKMTGDDGRIVHAEVHAGDGGVVMFGRPGDDYRNPKRLGAATQSIYVYVDDVDSHFEQAKAAGAEVLREPADQFYGDRTYMVADPEGHQWGFATHVRDVSEEEMQTAGATS